MTAISASLSELASWAWGTSLKAGVLVIAILLIQLVAGSRLSPRWRHGLWMLLLVRLLLPWSPETSFSLYRAFPGLSHDGGRPQERDDRPERAADGRDRAAWMESGVTSLGNETVSQPTPFDTTASGSVDPRSGYDEAPPQPVRAGSAVAPPNDNRLAWLPLIWLAGALGVAAFALRQVFTMERAVRHCRILTQERILDLLEDCKEQMGIRAYLAVVESPRVESPSLFGFVRPRLLLPEGMIEKLSPEELRHLFLHELGHLRRFDIVFGWLMAVAQVLHWFNPLIWYALYRMRAEREMACDALVLSCEGPVESSAYGKTMIRLAELFSQPRRLANLAGALEKSSQLRRRIQMIAEYEKPNRRLSLVALCAFVALACVALTDPAPTPQSDWRMKERPFVTDPEVVGQWTTVDFVRSAELFQPGQRQWKDDLYLKGLSFRPDGRTSGPWRWTNGWLQHPGDKSEGRYAIRQLDGATYLFMDWISGDVTIRGEKPRIYVLKKEAATATANPVGLGIPKDAHPPEFWAMKARPFVPDPDLVGSWTSVDFVDSPEYYAPGKQQWTGNLYLKQMTFAPDGGTAGPWRWTKDWIQHPGDKTEGRYWIRQLEGGTYLFMEWISGDVTIRGQQPSLYVLKKETQPVERPAVESSKGKDTAQPASWRMQDRPFVLDPDLVGQWTSVDFVRQADQFQPGKRQWNGDLFLKRMEFQGDGRTSGPWRWTKGWIQHPGDKSEGRYTIRRLDGVPYLFMEWISGDVTVRGQQPCLYVLVKSAAGSDQPR